MECARGFVVEAEDNLGGLAHRPIAQRNQRRVVVALQLKHIAIGQRNLQIPSLDIAKKPFMFDSTDSSSWVAGNRFGHVYVFDPQTGLMKMICKKQGQRVKHLESAVHNLHEWMKFQKYLSTIKN